MNYLNYIITPVVGAIIGYLTNWLAIKMLFRPYGEKRIFGVRLPFTPGLIPKEREQLTQKIADTVSAFVLTPEVLTKELSSSSVWTLPDATIGEVLAQLGIEDPTPYVERMLLELLRDERVQTTLTTAASTTIHDFITAIQDKWLAEGTTPGELLPESIVAVFKDKSAELLPVAVTHIQRWPEDNPWLDEKLSDMVRSIVNENFGRLVGLFIDYKKIYANIKDGLFKYLSDMDNQLFMTEQLNKAVDTFCATEIKKLTDRLPEGVLDHTLATAEDKLTAFLSEQLDNICRTSLPKPATDAIRKLCGAVCALRLQDIAAYLTNKGERTLLDKGERTLLDPSEKKAALPAEGRFKRALEKLAAYVAEHMQIREMIVDKLNAFAVNEVEQLILSVVNRELQAITILGGVLGFVIGLITVLPRLFMP